MSRQLLLKLRKNKRNGQYSIDLPKKKLPKEMIDFDVKKIKMELLSWE